MPNSLIPEDVRQFILGNIDSIAQWEGLLLLRGSPETEWTTALLAERLYIGNSEATQLLEQLLAKELVTYTEAGYRYRPQSPEHEALLERMAELYTRCLVPFTDLIHSKRTRIQKFADAFWIRKD